MRWLTKMVHAVLLALNLLSVLLLLGSAFSELLPPERFPLLSLMGLTFAIWMVINVGWILFWLIFHRRSALLSAVALLCCFAQARSYAPINFGARASQSEKEIKIITYNVHHLDFDSGSGQPLEETRQIIEFIGRQDADIVCMQEAAVGGRVANCLKRELAQYPYSQASSVNDNCFFCLSKHPILSTTPLAVEGQSAVPAVCYSIRAGDDTLCVVNCHLQSNALSIDDRAYYGNSLRNKQIKNLKSDTAKNVVRKLRDAVALRAAQVRALESFAAQYGGRYLVVCGDMNDVPVSFMHRRLTRHLNDAHTRAGNGFDISFNQNYLYFRIDHLFIGPAIKPLSCEVDNSIAASDHYPLVARIALRP